MLDEAATPGVMIFASCCGATKSVAPFVDEHFGQCAKARINDRANGLHDKFPVRCLFFAQVCRFFQQFPFFLFREWPYRPLVCFESILRVYTKVASKLDETFGGECAACFVSGMITPY